MLDIKWIISSLRFQNKYITLIEKAASLKELKFKEINSSNQLWSIMQLRFPDFFIQLLFSRQDKPPYRQSAWQFAIGEIDCQDF